VCSSGRFTLPKWGLCGRTALNLPLALRRINESSIASSGKPAIPSLDNDTARTDERIAPEPKEVVFPKTTTGTLGSSPLGQNFLSLGYSSVCVAGIVTDGCVSQTARELADMDFDVTIIEDACASYVGAHHRAVLEIFANYYGTVNSADRIIAMAD
jgi:nicotinamidase-related amidase